MMKRVDFKCEQCGGCCTDLLDKSLGIGMRGLYLQKNEIHLFPKEHVKPMYATRKGRSRPRPDVIFAYQLDLNTCPHLKGNSCSIYEKRPTICRSFPFEAGAASRKCFVIASQISDKEQFTTNNDLIRSEIEANKKHLRFLTPYLGKGSFFTYDLATGKWSLQVKKTPTSRPPPQLAEMLREIKHERTHKHQHAKYTLGS
jgi:Fe-S-cluster containining protein